MMSVSHSVEKERCQKVTNSIGGGNSSAKSTPSPFSHFLNLSFNLLSRANTRLTLSNHQTARRLPNALGIGGGSRALVHIDRTLRTIDFRTTSKRP